MSINTTFECYCSPFQGCLSCDWVRNNVPEAVREQRRHGLILRGHQPPLHPLQKAVDRRARALTLPLPVTNGLQSDRPIPSQLSCAILTRLPIELRQKIWLECLEEASTVHLYTSSRTSTEPLHLHSTLCHCSTPEKCSLFRSEDVLLCSNRPRRLRMPKRKLHSLLFTCRRM